MKRRPLPNDFAVDEAFDTIKGFDQRKGRRRLKLALVRERYRSGDPDGYSRGTQGGGGRGLPRITVENEEGEMETVEVTSVELAVIAREGPSRDAYRDHLDLATRAAGDAASALARLDQELDALDNITSTEELNPEPGCWAMGRVDSWEPIWRRTEHAGTYYNLGRWAYDFLGKTGRLPTMDECRRHAQGRKVALPADAVPSGRFARRRV